MDNTFINNEQFSIRSSTSISVFAVLCMYSNFLRIFLFTKKIYSYILNNFFYFIKYIHFVQPVFETFLVNHAAFNIDKVWKPKMKGIAPSTSWLIKSKGDFPLQITRNMIYNLENPRNRPYFRYSNYCYFNVKLFIIMLFKCLRYMRQIRFR